MKFILDTCALIYLVMDPYRLRAETRNALEGASNESYILAASAWEVACAVGRGRLQIDRPWSAWFRHFAAEFHVTILPVDLPCIEEAATLPDLHHNDPIDRLIIAQARLAGMTVVTNDRLIRDYPHVSSLD